MSAGVEDWWWLESDWVGKWGFCLRARRTSVVRATAAMGREEVVRVVLSTPDGPTWVTDGDAPFRALLVGACD